MTESKRQRKIPKGDKLAAEIGRRILEARNGLGWSQQTLHAHSKMADPEGVGISRAVLSLYETGVNKPGSRELIILGDALKVTPNWLLCGSNDPLKTIQPSMVFLRGDDLTVSVRLAFALIALAPEEREAFAGMLFSLLNKSMGDVHLSMLMTMANMMTTDMHQTMLNFLGPEAEGLSVREIMSKFAKHLTEGGYSNYGNLRPVVPEDKMLDYDYDYPPPPRKLKDS